MDGMAMGTPWIDKPISLHSYRAYTCTLNTTEECKYQQGYWRFWYEADHRYALPTVAFFLAAILSFSLGYVAMEAAPARLHQAKMFRRVVALGRYLSYRSMRLNNLNWNTAPIGVLLLGGIGTIYFLSMTLGPKPYFWPNTQTLSYGNSMPIATRSGWMSLACMPFVFATAGKSNWITLIIGVSYERLQVFHRWISYAMYLLALIHTFPFIVYNIRMGTMVEQWDTSVTYWTGVVALLAQSWLTFASFGPIRNACYEWFKLTHFLAALIFVLFFFFHCDHTLSSWDYFLATSALFASSWLHRHLRIYFEYGIKHRATLSLASNGFVRLSVPTKATWGVGQHYNVRLVGLGLHGWTVHPFTACSLPERVREGQSVDSELILHVRPRGGFTARLAKHAGHHPNAKMRILLYGPYGGVDMRRIVSSDRFLVVAGGSGAGWMIPLISAFQRRLALEPQGLPSMRVILATRDVATQRWFEDAITDLSLGDGRLMDHLKLEMFYTGGCEDRSAPRYTGQFLAKPDDLEKAPVAEQPYEIHSNYESSDTKSRVDGVRHFDYRPDLPGMVEREAHEGDRISVLVCGPLSMQSDVANAVARQQASVLKGASRDIYLHLEHFSWA